MANNIRSYKKSPTIPLIIITTNYPLKNQKNTKYNSPKKLMKLNGNHFKKVKLGLCNHAFYLYFPLILQSNSFWLNGAAQFNLDKTSKTAQKICVGINKRENMCGIQQR